MNSTQVGFVLLTLLVTVTVLIAVLTAVAAAVLSHRGGANWSTAVVNGAKALGGTLTLLIAAAGVAIAAFK
ncbi:hypothetical protein [Kitasatospora sp. HPMI-4]|uniref:hypothetical protein n=1 Tax=Kitasatospora sp. HPMI-4 TaxID=3448443 RepID=UPI003F1AB650